MDTWCRDATTLDHGHCVGTCNDTPIGFYLDTLGHLPYDRIVPVVVGPAANPLTLGYTSTKKERDCEMTYGTTVKRVVPKRDVRNEGLRVMKDRWVHPVSCPEPPSADSTQTY